MAKMKYAVKQVRFCDLETESFNHTEPTIYAVEKSGVIFEILIKRREESRKAVVFGTGTIMIPKEEWPIFSRQTWMDYIPYNCIYYFDPTLFFGHADTGWGYGTNERWYLRDIAEIISIILKTIHILPEDTLMMGSSGGGFTSIMLATMLHARCQAINPQIDFRRYKEATVERLKKAVIKPGEKWIEERANVVAFMRAEQYIPYMHIFQNIIVEHDIYNHIIPLMNRSLIKFIFPTVSIIYCYN